MRTRKWVFAAVAAAAAIAAAGCDSPADGPEGLPRLAAPANVAVAGTMLTWDTVAGSDGYRVLADGQSMTTVPAGSWDLRGLNLPVGQSRQMTVVALGVPGESRDSHPSDPPAAFTAALPPPELGISLSPASHDFGSFPAGYAVGVGEGEARPLAVAVSNIGTHATGALTAALSGPGSASFALTDASISSIAPNGSAVFTVAPVAGLTYGTHIATVTVSGDGISASLALTFIVYNPGATALAAPTSLSIAGTTLSWTAASGATGHLVYANGRFIGQTAAASFDLAGANLSVGTHRITVISTGDPATAINSQPSASVDFTVAPLPLPAPSIMIDGMELSWEPVPGAGGFRILVGGLERASTASDALGFDLAGLSLALGQHSVTVVALGIPGQSLDSPPSIAATAAVEAHPLELSGQVWKWIEEWSCDVCAHEGADWGCPECEWEERLAEYDGPDLAVTSHIGGAGDVTGGYLSFDIDMPNALACLLEALGYFGVTHYWAGVAASPPGAQGALLVGLDAGPLLLERFFEEWGAAEGVMEISMSIFAEQAVTISGTGRTGPTVCYCHEWDDGCNCADHDDRCDCVDGTVTTQNFSIPLLPGWNDVHLAVEVAEVAGGWTQTVALLPGDSARAVWTVMSSHPFWHCGCGYGDCQSFGLCDGFCQRGFGCGDSGCLCAAAGGRAARSAACARAAPSRALPSRLRALRQR